MTGQQRPTHGAAYLANGQFYVHFSRQLGENGTQTFVFSSARQKEAAVAAMTGPEGLKKNVVRKGVSHSVTPFGNWLADPLPDICAKK